MIACANADDDITGVWNVNSKFYTATYEIAYNGKNLEGKVLRYNDGTTAFKDENDRNWYLFHNLEKQDNVYIDAISGATETKNRMVSLQLLGQDTLKVSYLFPNQQSRAEFWIRNH